MTSGDLGTVRVAVSTNGSGSNVVLHRGVANRLVATFPDDGSPLAVTMSFSSKEPPLSVSEACAIVATQRAAAEVSLATGAREAGGLVDAYEAMATAIAWNVNFDPRVSVTAPVSRTFEAGFDFIFFDWDM